MSVLLNLVFIGTVIAPILLNANKQNNHSGLLGIQIATLSCFLIPNLSNELAVLSTSRVKEEKVQLSDSNFNAILSGYFSDVFFKSSWNVSF